jgi:hypothetical protein
MKNISYWVATKKAKPALPKTRNWCPWASVFTAVALPTARLPPAPAAIAPTAPAFRRSTRAWVAACRLHRAQLIAFRDGVRKNSVQMNQVAAKLNDREIKAVSDYIAGLR